MSELDLEMLEMEIQHIDLSMAVAEISNRDEKFLVVDYDRPSKRNGGREWMPVTRTREGSGVRYDESGKTFDTRGILYRFRCPTCRLDVPMRQDRLCKLFLGLVEAGVSVFDLSRARIT